MKVKTKGKKNGQGKTGNSKKQLPMAKPAGPSGSNKAKQGGPYYTALTSPFASGATGARVPDMYSFPTATYRLTKRFVVSTNSAGRASFVLLPSAFVHAWSPDGPHVDAKKWVVTNPADLDAKLSSHRIVGWGAKFNMITSALNTKGRAVMASTVCATHLPDWKFGLTGATISGVGEVDVVEADNNLDFLVGLGYPHKQQNSVDGKGTGTTVSATEYGLDGASFTALPYHKVMGLPELQASNVVLPSKLVTPNAFAFRQSANRELGFDVADQSTLVNVKAGNADYRDLRGWSSYAFVLEGLDANTDIGEIELIYHLEGNMPVSTTTSLIAPSSSAATINMQKFHSAIENASNSPWFKLAASAARLLIA